MILRLILSLLALGLADNAAWSQNRSFGTAVDPYIVSEHTDATVLPGYRNIDGRTLANPQNIGGSKKCVIAFFGQSNSAANYGQGTYTILNPSQIWNLNLYNGGLYLGAAPILGAGGTGETWAYRYADKLIAGSTCDRVVIASAALSSTLVANWAVGGFANSRISALAKRIAATGLQASGVIFQQGESDQVAGTSQGAYATSLSSVISTIQAQAAFSGVPIFIPQTSYYLGSTSIAVRAAQSAATNGTTIFNLGDSDAIGSGSRHDNIHFNATGADSWATTVNSNSASHLIVHLRRKPGRRPARLARGEGRVRHRRAFVKAPSGLAAYTSRLYSLQ